MSRGVLLFAFNNPKVDYVKMAEFSAARIKRHLGLPVAVVTDQPIRNPNIDYVIAAQSGPENSRYFNDFEQHLPWHNTTRADAYQLSPFEETLVLDVDYVVASQQLLTVFDHPGEFVCHRLAMDVTNTEDEHTLNTFGRHRLPQWWATVIRFRKSNTVQYIFDSMIMIRDNWQHYRDLYGISSATYRNDIALSIAIGLVSGQTWQIDSLPWKLCTVMPQHQVQQVNEDGFIVSYVKDSKPSSMFFAGLDFHMINKQNLETLIADASC